MPVGNGEMSCNHYLNATITIQNLYKTYDRSGESKQMAHSLKAVENMLKANGVIVFSGEKALLEVADYLNKTVSI